MERKRNMEKSCKRHTSGFVLDLFFFFFELCRFHFQRGWQVDIFNWYNPSSNWQCSNCHPWDSVPRFHENASMIETPRLPAFLRPLQTSCLMDHRCPRVVKVSRFNTSRSGSEESQLSPACPSLSSVYLRSLDSQGWSKGQRRQNKDAR